MRRSLFLTSLALAAFPPRGASAAPESVPLEPASPVPVVRARIGTRDFLMLVDSGDEISTLSPAAADALALARTPIPGTPMARATLRGVSLGTTVLRDHPAVLVDPSDLRRQIGFAVDGSLGYAAFNDRIITLDYRARALTFPDRVPSGERAAITWLQYHSRSPKLVTVDGFQIDGHRLIVQFDTAMSRNAIVFTTKVPGLTLAPAPDAAPYSYEEAALHPVRAAALRLAATMLATNAIVYAAGADAHIPTTEIRAVIGDALFADRAVTIDFPNSLLVVSM